MSYYVYILQSSIDRSFYIGYSNDVNRRLAEHNAGLSHHTSKKIPWEIFYVEEFDNKSDAIKRELFLKRQKNRAFYMQLKSQQG